MATLKKGKAVRVKANVAQTTAYDFADSSSANIVRYFKAGEEIGTITNETTFDGSDDVEYVEILLSQVDYTGIEQFDVNIVYVPYTDIDIIGEDVDSNDTLVYNENGDLLEGSAYEYPDAIPTGQTKNGKRVFLVKTDSISAAESQRPKWLTFALWVLVGTGLTAFAVVIYKSLSK